MSYITSNGVVKPNQRRTSLSSSESSEDWIDVNDESQNVVCIFTNKQYKSAHDYFMHLKDFENFDIWQLVMGDLKLNFFAYVKLINFLRTNYCGKIPPSSSDLKNNRKEWEDDVYLKPVSEDDPLLQFMIGEDDDSDVDSDNELEQLAIKKFIETPDHDEMATQKLLEKEREINKNLRENLERATKQIEEMKNFMHNVILSGSGDFTRSVSACRQQKIEGNLEEEEIFEDSGYFGTYSHHEIHAEMLQDVVRTETYKKAVFSNASFFKDKIVLDVGCGTGILSMFCAQAGAKHVYGVDMSDMAYQAIDIIRDNGFGDKITIIKSTVEEAVLPVDKVDIIISEWMGYFLLYESMFDSVIFARNKWLNDDGVMLPSACTIHLVGAHGNLYQRRVGFWSDVYGFKMPSIRKQAVSEGYIINISKDELITESCEVFALPTKTAESDDLNFKSTFTLKVLQSTLLSTIVGYFDCFFTNLENSLKFSTGPCHPLTHWKQTCFFLENPIEVKKDDEISCEINCRKNIKDPRSLIVNFKLGSNEQTFKIE